MTNYLAKYDLQGNVALVTGGARGIGLACVDALAQAGAAVVIADRDLSAAQESQAALAANGAQIDVVELDVTKPDQVSLAAAEVAARHGRIDILVNNAGIAKSDTPSVDIQDDDWLRILDVNLNGVFWCCREFGRIMTRQRSGSIVNIGSMSGFIVNKPQPQPNYNASKAAVHHLTKSLAAEWAPFGVRVNAVAPTYIDTPLTRYGAENPDLYHHWISGTPMARMGTTDEVASVVLFLSSQASSLLTGAIILADGGYTCW